MWSRLALYPALFAFLWLVLIAGERGQQAYVERVAGKAFESVKNHISSPVEDESDDD